MQVSLSGDGNNSPGRCFRDHFGSRPRYPWQYRIRADLPVHVVGETEQVAKRRAAVGRRPDSREGDRLRLVGEGQEDNAVCRQQRRGRADDGDAEALSDQGQKGATPHVEAQDRRRRPALGMA